MLCKLANSLRPGIAKVGPAKMPFHKMENINRFIEAAQQLGVKELDVFAKIPLAGRDHAVLYSFGGGLAYGF